MKTKESQPSFRSADKEIVKDSVTYTRVARIFAVVLFSFLCLQASIDAQTPSIRIMTFNIRYDEPRDGVNAWPNRKQKVADVIRFHKADIVGVQEALLTQLRDLETLLPGFAWVGVGRTDGKEAGEYSPILYRKDRFRLINSDTFW